VLRNFSGVGLGDYQPPKLCFDVEMYDRKRGRSITDGRVPGEVFMGSAYEFKSTGTPVRFDVDSEIEPRVYVNQLRPSGVQIAADHVFDASQVAAYLNIVWKGYYALEQHRKEAP
jgi:hypothetical protein